MSLSITHLTAVVSISSVPTGLRRYQQAGHLHFITFSCYRRQALLTPEVRDLFAWALEAARRSYRFFMVGYVIMPEHVHLLVGEPERRLLATGRGTRPNAQIVSGESEVATSEQVSQISFTVGGVPVNPFGALQGRDAALDVDSRVIGVQGLCNDFSLPDGLDSAIDQYLFAGGIFVRHNINHIMTSAATVTNYGPTN